MNDPIVARTRKIRELPDYERPAYRIASIGATAMSDGELLVLLTGLPDLDTAQVLLARAGGLYGLARMSAPELRRLVRGVGPQRAAAIRAAIEFGKRVAMTSGFDRLQVKDPNTIGQMLQLDMGALDQEELRVVALDTKQRILCVDQEPPAGTESGATPAVTKKRTKGAKHGTQP